MTPLSLATLLALIATCAAVVLAALSLARDRFDVWADRATWIAAGLTTIPLALLVAAFLRADLSTFYVWENTHASYAWWLRVAGVWGGQAGTFLLWGWAVLGAAALEARRPEPGSWPYARGALLVTAALLLLAPVLLELGAPTSSFGLDTVSGTFERGISGIDPLDVRPEGQGLNPLLESVYMAIHPPIQFLAYGMAAVPFAYGLAHLGTGAPYREPCARWARGAWLGFLVAITLGSLWAYHVLSFGGYWIWDPVEIGNLLPLLALTVHLHANRVRDREHLGLLTPASAVAAFVLVIFATFITRSGLWSSVHAFLPTGLSISIQDPIARLSAAVGSSFQARYATALLLAAVGAFAAAASAFHARRTKGHAARAWRVAAIVYGGVGLIGLLLPETIVSLLHQVGLLLALGQPLGAPVALLVLATVPLLAGLLASPESTPTTTKTRDGQLVLSAAVLSLALVATVVLLVLGVNGYGPSVFEVRAPIIAVPVLGLVALSIHSQRHGRRLAWLVGGVLGAALVFAFSRSWAYSAIPLCLASGVGPAWLFIQRAGPGRTRRELARSGLLLGAGVLGFVQWTSPGVLVLGGVALPSPAAYVPVGLVASAIAVLAPFRELRERVPSWLGPLAGVMAVGYGLGALMALGAALVGIAGLGGPRLALEKAGVPLIHLGVVLLLLGVALSTYGTASVTYDQADPLVRGEPRQAGPYTLELVGGRLDNQDDDSLIEEVVAVVHVFKHGTFVDEIELRLSHSFNAGFSNRGAYVPEESPVTRSWEGDLAHNADTTTPLAIGVRDANRTWITANGPPPQELTGRVDAVSMGVEQLPGVNLVWGSIPLIGLGLLVRMQAPWPTRVDDHRHPTAK